MTSAPGAALASIIACRSEPGPPSAALVTAIVALAAADALCGKAIASPPTSPTVAESAIKRCGRRRARTVMGFYTLGPRAPAVGSMGGTSHVPLALSFIRRRRELQGFP